MTDQVIVYNRNGVPLAELPVMVVREYRSESTVQVGKGSFQIATDDPKATRANLQYNNIVVVRSDLGIPDWCGLIWTPTKIDNGKITITLRSIEWILGQRILEQEDLSGVPGDIFETLIYYTEARGDTIINDDVSGIDRSAGYVELGNIQNNTLYSIANNLANSSGYYWSLKPVIPSPGGRLELRPIFTPRTGRNFVKPLINGQNLFDIKIEEVGDIVNDLTVEGRAEGITEPFIGVERDEESIGLYGLIEGYKTNVTVRGQGSVDAYTQALLQKIKKPFLRVAGTVTTRPFPFSGDKVPVDIGLTAQYLNRPSGAQYYRVKTSRYDPANDTVNILLEEEPE